MRIRTSTRAAAAAVLLSIVVTGCSRGGAGHPGVAGGGPGTIATAAGGPGEGPPVDVAQSPYYLAVSGSHLYVSDLTGNVVRDIRTDSGDELPIAGDGSAGDFGDGLDSAVSSINQPAGIGTDPAGDVFFADQNNNRIREIPDHPGVQFGVAMQAGKIYTIAGTGHNGSTDDGIASIGAQLSLPEGLAVDPLGDVIFADTYSGRIREVSTSDHVQFGISMGAGRIYTVAGNGEGGLSAVSGDGGPARAAAIGTPQGVSLDVSGNVYVTEDFNQQDAPVREIAAATHVQFGIPMTAGNIYSVAGGTTPKACVGQIDLIGDGCAASSASLSDPVDAVADSAGNLYVTDYYDNRLRRVDAMTGVISTIAGTGQAGYGGDGGPALVAELALPTGIALDTGTIYVSDSTTVRRIDISSGDIRRIAGNFTFSNSGDGRKASTAQMGAPVCVAFDAHQNLYLVDALNNVVRMVTASTGTITAVAGQGSGVGDVNAQGGYGGDGGPPERAELDRPSGVAVDRVGDVYIADTGNNRIRVIPATLLSAFGEGAPRNILGRDLEPGNIYTIAGNNTAGFGGEGALAQYATLDRPQAVALDARGDLFIADSGNDRVREIAAADHEEFGISMTAGHVYTVAGSGVEWFGGDGGPAVLASLSNPTGLTIDPAGDLFVADTGNDRIREVAGSAHSQLGIAMQTGHIYTVAGDGVPSYSGDLGPARMAGLSTPIGVAVDTHGNLFIADTANRRIREVSARSGVIDTVAGTGASGFTGDGSPAALAAISDPTQPAFDAAGNLYFGDLTYLNGFGYTDANGRVREIIGVGR